MNLMFPTLINLRKKNLGLIKKIAEKARIDNRISLSLDTLLKRTWKAKDLQLKNI